MNKITIVDDKLIESKFPKKLEVSYEASNDLFGISNLTVKIHKSTDIELSMDIKSRKIKVDIIIDNDVISNIYCYQNIEESKIQYNFIVDGCINFYKFQDISAGKEMVSAHLLNSGASINYYLKDICKIKETIDYYIHHDVSNTYSMIKNNVVSKDEGNSIIQVSTFVPKGCKGCIANQISRTISFNNTKNEIRPNLYIDEFDVEANHSALIGMFSKDELFYLMSRGINKEKASELLLKGFLLSDINNKKMISNIMSATER